MPPFFVSEKLKNYVIKENLNRENKNKGRCKREYSVEGEAKPR